MSSENPTDIKSESSGATPVDPQQTKKVSLELIQYIYAFLIQYPSSLA